MSTSHHHGCSEVKTVSKTDFIRLTPMEPMPSPHGVELSGGTRRRRQVKSGVELSLSHKAKGGDVLRFQVAKLKEENLRL